jgi:hypothetical protein
MGSKKQRGEARFCVHCTNTGRTRQTTRVFEDIIHVFASCPLASSLWRLVLAWWRRCTGESLNHLDVRVCVLGSRSLSPHPTPPPAAHGQPDAPSGPDEPWCLLHGVTLDVLWRARVYAHAHPDIPSLPPSALLGKVRARLGDLANLRYQEVCHLHAWEDPSAEEEGPNSIATFCAQWVDSGIARLVGIHSSRRVLLE